MWSENVMSFLESPHNSPLSYLIILISGRSAETTCTSSFAALIASTLVSTETEVRVEALRGCYAIQFISICVIADHMQFFQENYIIISRKSLFDELRNSPDQTLISNLIRRHSSDAEPNEMKLTIKFYTNLQRLRHLTF